MALAPNTNRRAKKSWRSRAWIQGNSDVEIFWVRFRSGALENFVKAHVDAVASVLVPHHGNLDLLFRLVLELNNLLLRRGDVGSKSQQERASDALLNGHLRAGILAIPGRGIDSELRDTGQVLNALGDLTGNALRQYGLCTQGSRRGGVGGF